MTIHLVYPVDFSKISAPWTLGNNLYKYFISKNLKVKVYKWTSFEKIYPNENDILIGHAHPNPLTCFRRSMKSKKWKSINLLQPYNEDPYQMSYINNFINDCHNFFSITGDYWFDRIDQSIFKSWKSKMIQVNMGIERNHYPKLKYNFNKIKNRKFLYIGNDYEFNNFAKNLNYLDKIINLYNHNFFGIAGNKKINKSKFYGWLNFKDKKSLKIIENYDFYLIVSKNDANPTTILEAMSWGLIPISTKECGFYQNKGIINLPLNNVKKSVHILKNLQIKSEKYLINCQKLNYKKLNKDHNWNKICNKIFTKMMRTKTNLKFYQTEKEKLTLKKFEMKSKTYYRNINNIIKFFLSSTKFMLRSFLRLN